jgi:hypothetical protein
MKGREKGNLIEISVLGVFKQPEITSFSSSQKSLFCSTLFEIFENDVHSLKYNITTYRHDRKEEFSTIANLVEIYQIEEKNE